MIEVWATMAVFWGFGPSRMGWLVATTVFPGDDVGEGIAAPSW